DVATQGRILGVVDALHPEVRLGAGDGGEAVDIVDFAIALVDLKVRQQADGVRVRAKAVGLHGRVVVRRAVIAGGDLLGDGPGHLVGGGTVNGADPDVVGGAVELDTGADLRAWTRA